MRQQQLQLLSLTLLSIIHFSNGVQIENHLEAQSSIDLMIQTGNDVQIDSFQDLQADEEEYTLSSIEELMSIDNSSVQTTQASNVTKNTTTDKGDYRQENRTFNYNQFLWETYLHEEGQQDLYKYDKKTNEITLEENSMDEMAAKADLTLRRRLLERNRTIVSLLQQKHELEETIKNITNKQQQVSGLTQANATLFAQVLKQKADEVKKLDQKLNQTMNNTNKRVLHIIPHSHTDEGWLSTTDEFFTGDDVSSIYVGSVRDILDSVVFEMGLDKNRTFTFSEIKYFKIWWDMQLEDTKEPVRQMIREGRFDLVSGGWSAPDEATTQYDSIIDNLMIGQQFLQKEFALHPIVSWQLDAFGVSTGYARMAHDVGFDMMVYARVDLMEKRQMRQKKSRSQVWRPHEENFGKRKDILGITLDQQRNSSLGAYCWPQGFWADTNYLLDVPMILKEDNPGFKFDKIVKALYQEMSEYLDNERTNQVFRPFGCDMAFVDAKVNYKIMDELLRWWKKLGLDQDMEIKYSTPTRFAKEMAQINKNLNDSDPHAGWPIRRDDSYPYSQGRNVYMNGYYTSRPQLKRNIRIMVENFHSSLRLITQQMLRRDNSDQDKQDLIKYHYAILDILGNLQHHDSITGTSADAVSIDFNMKALYGAKTIKDTNAKFLIDRLYKEHGVEVFNLTNDLDFKEDHEIFGSSYAKYDEFAVVIQNPSQQVRQQYIEIQVPYYNYTIHELNNGKLKEITEFEKFLPRLWKNSNRTSVKAFCSFKVDFAGPNELSKVYVFKNKGVIKGTNLPPANYTGTTEIWNLNLKNIFNPRFPSDIDNFQTNFRKIRPQKMITVGNKTLKFIKVIESKKMKLQVTPIPVDVREQQALEQAANGSLPEDQTAEVVFNKQGLLVQKNNTHFKNGTKKPENPNRKLTKEEMEKKSKNKERQDDNAGAAIFEYTDKETGISQRFAFNLRYYIGADWKNTGEKEYEWIRQDGMYEFSVNGTGPYQRSYKYGQVNLKKSRIRQNNNSGEFLLVYEQRYSFASNATDKIRATARINMNSVENMLKFQVSLNEIPIAMDKAGKDIVADWYFLDDFNSGEEMWIDSNGLQMIPKKLFARRDWQYVSNNTISANYYPKTSAIAIRDHGPSSGKNNQKQILIMNDIAQGCSAGLRGNKNIEIMQNRRMRKHDHYGVQDALNDTDEWGRGIQVKSNYWLQFSNAAQNGTVAGHSRQREFQKQLDLPFLIYYSHDYSLNIKDDYKQAVQNSSAVNEMYSQILAQTILKTNHSFNASAFANATNTTKEGINATAAVMNMSANQTNITTFFRTYEPNTVFKQSKTLKVLPFLSMEPNEILIRISSYEDRFDKDAKTQHFDINAWARDYYLEANLNLVNSTYSANQLLDGIQVNVTEMNLPGTVPLANFTNSQKWNQTKWLTPKVLDPKNNEKLKKPKDRIALVTVPTMSFGNVSKPLQMVQVNETYNATLNLSSFQLKEENYQIAMEPQRIRTFKIQYFMPEQVHANFIKLEMAKNKNSTAAATSSKEEKKDEEPKEEKPKKKKSKKDDDDSTS